MMDFISLQIGSKLNSYNTDVHKNTATVKDKIAE
jgi:hypothetical protein